MRVRCFTQDDAHIFMTEDQIQGEIQSVVRLIDEVYTKFGFSYEIELSTRPENSIGSDEKWELATCALRDAVSLKNLKKNEVRTELDDGKEKLGYKIREARLDKVPYMVIVGEKEQKNGTVSVRCRDLQTDQQAMGEMKTEALIQHLLSR